MIYIIFSHEFKIGNKKLLLIENMNYLYHDHDVII